MGFKFSLLATKETFTLNNLEKFSQMYKVNKLEFQQEVNFIESQNFNFNNDYIDFYFGKNGTLAFFSSPTLIEDIEIEDSSILTTNGTFWVDELSMTYQATVFDNLELLYSFSHVNGKLLSTNGKRQITGNYFNEIVELIQKISSENYFNFHDNDLLFRFKVDKKDTTSPQIQNKTLTSNESQFINNQKIINSDELYITEIFNSFITDNENIIVDIIEKIKILGTNKIINSYLLNLAFYHPSKKVRNASKLSLSIFTPEIFERISKNMDSSNLKEQNYYYKRLVFHEDLCVDEYSFLGTFTRKNYFSKYPPKGYNLYLDGRGDDIKRALHICMPFDTISNRIKYLSFIDYVKIMYQDFVNLEYLVEKLVLLPNLKTLFLQECNIKEIGSAIYLLSKLERLILSNNPISFISDNGIFENLEELDISKTQIKKINLSSFPNLKKIYVDSKEQRDQIIFLHQRNKIVVTSGVYYSELV